MIEEFIKGYIVITTISSFTMIIENSIRDKSFPSRGRGCWDLNIYLSEQIIISVILRDKTKLRFFFSFTYYPMDKASSE